MKKLNSSAALTALAAILMAAPVAAADIEAPVPSYDWSAFHIGVGGGGNFAFVQEDANSFIDEKDGPESPRFFTFAEHSADLGDAAFFGTIEAGADYQLGSSVVIGLLANYDFGKAKMDNQSDSVVFVDDTPGPGFSIVDTATYKTEWEIGDSWAIGGRLGFLAMDDALIYAMAGYTQAKVKSESSLFGDHNANFAFHTSDSSWEDGWFVGGGIEALLTHNISLKAEYRYNDYGSVDRDDSIDTNPGAPFDYFRAGSEQEGDVTVHSVRAVLSYRFGHF